VHVWRADLTTVAEDLTELLCAEERARGERMLSEHDRELWRRSRGLLRALLGRYLRQDPGSLRFAAGQHGKPSLVHSSATSSGLSFNMSHSGGLALYALSESGAVGVDVELAGRPIDEVAIAARVFGEAEARRLQALDLSNRRQEFLRAWVRHEAELKCLGVGIGSAAGAIEERRLWVAQLELGPGAAGAVAAERELRELRRWDWTPEGRLDCRSPGRPS